MTKVLIIDDDESIRIILTRLVGESVSGNNGGAPDGDLTAGHEYRLLEAENGAEGIRIIEQEHPDHHPFSCRREFQLLLSRP